MNIGKKKLIIVGMVFAGLTALGLGGFGGYKYHNYLSEKEENKYAAFAGEVYQNIQDHYWQKAPDKELSKLFGQAVKQAAGKPYLLSEKNKNGVKGIIEKAVKDLNNKENPAEKKESLVTRVCSLVLQSLKPRGRSALYTQEQQKELAQKVSNVQPDKNPYEALGVSESATAEEIDRAYQKKKEEIEKGEVPKEEAWEIERAGQMLEDPQAKERYDKTGVRSTVFGRQLSPGIFYLRITRLSPATFQEFKDVVREADQEAGKAMDALILDLRDNIGGAIDFLPEFLGPFIGKNEYAYQFFHQEDYEPFKTSAGWLPGLVRYKKVVVLVNGGTQSSAEVMASVLKKYNVGVLVGTATKGWGTVEKVFELENQINPEKLYSVFLVHSLTLRTDEQPIQGKGMSPVIDVREEGWKEKLLSHFESRELADKTGEVWENPPI